MILFLDFDGVLHPSEVYHTRGSGIILRADGHNLFEHADLLVELLSPYPDVQIVLSTSWVAALRSYDRAKKYLPQALQERVFSATWHSSYGHHSAGWGWGSEFDRFSWNALTRHEQIRRYVRRHELVNWLEIDDDDAGWPDDQRHLLVCTNELGGLGDKSAQADLVAKLEGLSVKQRKKG